MVWRRRRLPEELVFDVTYLGGHMPTFALNFSRPGAQVLLQYYLFLRLGWEGYRRCRQSRDVAVYLRARSPRWRLRAVERRHRHPGLRVAAADGYTDKWNLYHLSERLRMKGWLVPAYPMPDDMSDSSCNGSWCATA